MKCIIILCFADMSNDELTQFLFSHEIRCTSSSSLGLQLSILHGNANYHRLHQHPSNILQVTDSQDRGTGRTSTWEMEKWVSRKTLIINDVPTKLEKPCVLGKQVKLLMACRVCLSFWYRSTSRECPSFEYHRSWCHALWCHQNVNSRKGPPTSSSWSWDWECLVHSYSQENPQVSLSLLPWPASASKLGQGDQRPRSRNLRQHRYDDHEYSFDWSIACFHWKKSLCSSSRRWQRKSDWHLRQVWCHCELSLSSRVMLLLFCLQRISERSSLYSHWLFLYLRILFFPVISGSLDDVFLRSRLDHFLDSMFFLVSLSLFPVVL